MYLKCSKVLEVIIRIKLRTNTTELIGGDNSEFPINLLSVDMIHYRMRIVAELLPVK